MPAISKIRLVNLTYEKGAKRYRDEIFTFDGHNGVILLENGGGKTVFVQAVLQAVLPHAPLAERRARDTFELENNPLHLAVEWILNEKPRRYALTAVTLFSGRDGLDSYKYVYEYESGDENSLENLPFVRENPTGGMRPASREEMNDYYQLMSRKYITARYFSHNREYQEYIEENFKIIVSEWRSIARINSAEGEIEGFFEGCRTTAQLVDRLLIPAVEEALAGKGSQDFAETFEKQRDHFKKHRQLNRRIEESQKVNAQVADYVALFAGYEQARQDLQVQKGEGKALYNMSMEKRSRLQRDEELLEQAREKLEQQRRDWQRKRASRVLAGLRLEMEKAGWEHREASREFEVCSGDYALHKQRLESLEVSRLRQEIRFSQEKADYYLSQLDELAADPDALQLEQRLADNSACLRFCFAREEDALEVQASAIIDQRQEMEADIQILNARCREKQVEYGELLVLKARAEQQMETAEEEMKKIAIRLLANPRHDDLKQEMQKWQQRTIVLERDREANLAEQRLLEQARQEIKREIPGLRQALQKDSHEELHLKNRLERIDEEHDQVLNCVKEINGEMFAVGSVYLHQNRVMNAMMDAVEMKRMEREQALVDESRAAALYNLYEESRYFTPDPRIQEWVEEWRDAFQYLESGTLFVQKAARLTSQKEKEYFDKYPFWAISLICSSSDTQRLQDRLKARESEITHPVYILTQEQARSLAGGGAALPGERGATAAGQIIPSSWQFNLEAPVFQDWKQELESAAKQARTWLDSREAQLQRASEYLHRLRGFLDKYPYEDYQQMKEALNKIRENMVFLEQELHRRESRWEEIDSRLNQVRKNLEAIREEHTHISHWITEGQEYYRRERACEQARREIRQYRELIENKELEMEAVERQRQGAEQNLARVNESLYIAKEELRRLRQNPLYGEVRETVPQATQLGRERLEIERKDLQDALRQMQKERRVLEMGLDAARKDIERLQRELQRKEAQCEYEIIEDVSVSPDLDEEIDRLIARVRLLQKEVNRAKTRLDKAQNGLNLASDRFMREEARFYEQFHELEQFPHPLETVDEMLEREEKELEQHQGFLNRQAEELAAAKNLVTALISELEKKDGRFDFLQEEIEAAELPSGSIQDFEYQPLKLVDRHMESLQESLEKVLRIGEDLERERKRLEEFCRKEIQDIRLKEMVISGLAQRDSLEEVEEWQKRLSDRIARALRHAQDEIREFDRELQAFINHLHTFLQSVAGELRIIPRKTRVRVEDGWKEIFLFDVPDWDEKEGKNELRRHIDWMVSQMESSHYRDDSGNEDAARLAGDIARWLQTRQLLRNIMKDKTIKVKCRKVTADSKVSGYPSSWESSNQWSGGEKWSKNMALFLGILNYLAEKRKAVNPKSRKSRTVVLDNPFGKASSDHVLDPVFFIAEQLGFQIIALTALAEGKFIRDYFPVVYSCRLRPAAGDKYIVTSEKEIRHAYLRDRNPEALTRLGSRRQEELL